MRTILKKKTMNATASTAAMKVPPDISILSPCNGFEYRRGPDAYCDPETRPTAALRGGLLRQDQLVVARVAQPIHLAAMADEQFALAVQEAAAVDRAGMACRRRRG